MIGVIRAWDVFFHPYVTVRCFGWQTFFRALWSGRGQTFLSLLGEGSFFASSGSEAAGILERCINLELSAKRIYEHLAETFFTKRPIADFFTELARQEQEHADLLRLCVATLRRSGWRFGYFNPWQEYLPRLEKQMREIESTISSVDRVDNALQLVVQIESSEINRVFQAAIGASNADFVKRLGPFRDAIEMHIGYMVMRISELAPNLMTVSRELRTSFPQRAL